MEQSSPERSRWTGLVVGGCLLALCAALWLWTPRLPENGGITSARFPPEGRLTIDEDALPSRGSLRLIVPMPDEAIGETPRPVRIASTDGRSIETTGRRSAGPDNEIEFSIDLHWLRAGQYLVEIQTAERAPLPMRRFVLEVR
ncbi:MAG: hypothetical protein QF570_04710 [Myxococcota bacterium]|jgi:hypothetical protein|nr:hypothetical protein [Myxococcota bacterium]